MKLKLKILAKSHRPHPTQKKLPHNLNVVRDCSHRNAKKRLLLLPQQTI